MIEYRHITRKRWFPFPAYNNLAGLDLKNYQIRINGDVYGSDSITVHNLYNLVELDREREIIWRKLND